ncbi:hypothetical protein LSAT2_026290 [Lamellibrachia satsuma]|nr:hypothetical protein LSAT2_026290 [Lamellibrachia satsuma]
MRGRIKSGLSAKTPRRLQTMTLWYLIGLYFLLAASRTVSALDVSTIPECGGCTADGCRCVGEKGSRSAGCPSLLVAPVCWLSQSAGCPSLLFAPVCWLPQSAGCLSLLVAPICCLPQSAGCLSLLVASVCWLPQSAG